MTAFLTAILALGSPGLSAGEVAFFETKIRPVLVERCFGCHSAAAKRLRGGLRLDSRQGVLEGGESGPAIVAGDPKASRLIEALRYDGDLKMPPEGKLADAVIADFVTWVAMGASDPRHAPPRPPAARPTIDFEKAREFWAFQAPSEPPVPAVRDGVWSRSPIDRFVLARLEEAGIAPAPPATRRALIRRVTYDLTGLPPTPEAVEAFVNDESPDALSRLVDRLLASPRYGEKWGRHWLDVARYADSNGVDENIAYANAYRYRDYVIRSFNADKPYDRFVEEQLAGDLLQVAADGDDTDRLIATGFLSIGPKMLACDDGRKMQLDIIDEQIDTVGRAFLGLTLGCARCHDHKFDPVPTADYYALAGIFKSTKTMENFKVVAEWHEHTVASPEERKRLEAHEKRIREIGENLEKTVSQAREAFLAAERAKTDTYFSVAADIVIGGGSGEPDGWSTLGDSLEAKEIGDRGFLIEAEKFQRGNLTVETTNYGKGIGVLLHGGFVEYDLENAKAGLYHFELRYAAQESRPVVVSLNGEVVKKDGANQVTGDWQPKGQRWHVEGAVTLEPGKNVLRLERQGPVPHIDKLLLVRFPDGAGASSASSLQARISRHALNEEILRQWIAFVRTAKKDDPLWGDWTSGDRLEYLAHEKVRRSLTDSKNGPFRSPPNPERFFEEETRTELATLRKERETLAKSKPKLARAMGVREGSIENLPVHIRGNYLTLGDKPVPRRFPRVIAGDDQEPIADGRSGRRELARWVTSGDQPLTARVMANRIWLWHFGEGLVRSANNFGTLGERPTNQALLDWLALRFVESGWSVKALHRRMLLASTYGMSTAQNPTAAAADPENRLRWRFDRRRLTAEEVRDAILWLGDNLDLELFGQLLPDKNRDYVTGTGSKEGTYDFIRRSVYLPILRSAVYQVFQTLNFPDPSVSAGQRAVTTVPTQALFIINSQIVVRESRHLAERLLREKPDDADRIRRAFELAFGRPPRTLEVEQSLEYVRSFDLELKREGVEDSGERRVRSWQSLCRVLMASNEFIFVE